MAEWIIAGLLGYTGYRMAADHYHWDASARELLDMPGYGADGTGFVPTRNATDSALDVIPYAPHRPFSDFGAHPQWQHGLKGLAVKPTEDTFFGQTIWNAYVAPNGQPTQILHPYVLHY